MKIKRNYRIIKERRRCFYKLRYKSDGYIKCGIYSFVSTTKSCRRYCFNCYSLQNINPWDDDL